MKQFFYICKYSTKQTNMQCPICYKDISEQKGTVTMECEHRMCISCFTTWARKSNTCPCCRDEFAEPPEKSGVTAMPDEMTIALVERHMTELNDYVDMKYTEIKPFMQFQSARNEETTKQKLHEMITWNIRVMAARVQLYYEK